MAPVWSFPTDVLELLQFQRYDRTKGNNIFKFNFNELKYTLYENQNLFYLSNLDYIEHKV
jgi:hypothetical protein